MANITERGVTPQVPEKQGANIQWAPLTHLMQGISHLFGRNNDLTAYNHENKVYEKKTFNDALVYGRTKGMANRSK